jgi:4-amino-4-deoxy-L-arabinose transferase-like glycosyltransferase
VQADQIERRVALVATIAAVAVFAIFLVLSRTPFPSFDEWKYFGIGQNIWAGRGLRTIFGGEFLLHGPIWSAVVTLPDALFGADSALWGRVLGGLSGMTVVALAGWFGWRIRPAAGAIAAGIMLGFLYLHVLSNSARLDVPSAAFALLYVAFGIEALRRNSVRWAIGAGVVFAIGFLIKEIDLPFIPVPFFVSVLWGLSWLVIGRISAWTILVASIGVAPWFLLYASETGHVYRAETPAWTLVPLGLGLAALVVIGLTAGRIAETRPLARIVGDERVIRRDWTIRVIVGLGGALVWAAAQLYAYSKAVRLKGGPIITPEQFDLYASQWIRPYLFAAAPAAVGLVLSIGALIAYWRRPERRPMVDLIIAGICGAPLVIFVVGVGESPRNYLAQIALAAPLSAIGWIWAIEWFIGERRAWITVPLATVAGAAAGAVAAWRLRTDADVLLILGGALLGFAIGWLPVLGPRIFANRWSLSRPLAVATTVVLVVGLASAALGVYTLRARPAASGPARSEAIRTTDAWVRENVPPGARLAFGSFLGYEMALTLSDQYDVSHARHGNVVMDPDNPDGIKRAGEQPADDWLSIDTAPRNINEFQAFRGSWLTRDLAKEGADYWIYTVGTATSAQTVLAAATPEHGLEQVAHFDSPIGTTGHSLDTYIFKVVDPGKVVFDPNVMYVAPEALERMLDIMERDPAGSRDLAARLEPQVVIYPESPEDGALMDRLRRLAGG